MTLDEAIAKAKADGDVQLAEWLRRARGADATSKWYTEKLRDANRTIRKLLDENAKLRGLASILCFCMQVHTQCDDCKLNGAKGEFAHDPLCACDGLHEILRELEIEVKK